MKLMGRVVKDIVEDIKRKGQNKNERIYIEDWNDLKTKIPQKSDTHILDIDVESCNGWIWKKDKVDVIDLSDDFYYLSTHTFYGSQVINSTRELQKRGFNVTLANWDKIEE